MFIGWLRGFFGRSIKVEVDEKYYKGVITQHESTIGKLSSENRSLKRGLEILYSEATKPGHIRKEKVQLMCMQALQVPK